MRRLYGSKWLLCTMAGLLLPVAMLRGDDPPAGSIVASKSSKVYHNRACSSAKKLNLDTALRFATEEEAKASGRRLCKVCAEQAAREPKNAPAQPPVEKSGPASNEKGGGAAPVATSQPAEPAVVVPVTATIKKVLPGGTLVTETGESLSLIGIVCPQPDQPMVKEMIRFIREQTRGRKVRVRAESSGARRDSLGRLQVYVFAQPGDRDLGEELLFQGLAWMDHVSGYDRFARYVLQQDQGAWDGRGIWKQAEDAIGNPDVVICRHGVNYHPIDCPHAAQLAEPRTVKLNQAKERKMTPCVFYRVPGGAATASRGEP